MPQQVFNSASGYQKFNVPKGVDRITLDLRGAGSGGANGGLVQGQLKVKSDDVLYILVGTQGTAASGSSGGAGGRGGGGAGGDGSGGRNGGRGGGGASAVRMNASDGTIKAVAGGAGGKSGDDGDGGDGGGTVGEHGSLGTSGSGQAGNATGGTQIQAGLGGSSSANSGLAGNNGTSKGLGTGGKGGQKPSLITHGGGGGGGGYRPGGGGVAALIGTTPGGGGGGGSNYTGGLFTGVRTSQGSGNSGDGQVTVSWNSPAPANQPPGSPSQAKIDDVDESPGMSTKSMGRVKVSAIVRDSDSHTVDPVHTGAPATQVNQKSRLVVRYSASSTFAHQSTVKSDYVDAGKRASVELTGLDRETHYYLRLYAEDKQGKLSENYNAVSFWTNRQPSEPDLQAPGDNSVVLDTDNVTFDWKHNDPDDNDKQSGFTLRWRRAANGSNPPGAWSETTLNTSFDNFLVGGGQFKAGTYYDWTVRTRDQQKVWGPYALPRSFFVLGSINPPTLVSPHAGHAVDVSVPVTLTWKFRDPAAGEHQVKADLRYRAIGAQEWNNRFGDTTTPGASPMWTLPVNTFQAGVHYEWQARTYHTADPTPSDWSDSEHFWGYGGLVSFTPSSLTVSQATGVLGAGHNRVYVYDRGGTKLRGEITPLDTVSWSRTRDEMANCTLTTNGFGADCGQLLASVHTWTHEIVVFRDGVRVWEGPITNILDTPTGFNIEAKDVTGYLYRRIMRQGYNDSYKIVNGVEEGVLSVVQRATMIAADALVRDDPNVLQFLTPFAFPDDAREARSVPDYSRTAFEEIDDLAANAGLDYSVIGRRIILNDTHRAIGRLPELRPEHFASPPVISEYGMQLADYYAVTNNSGLWGAVEKSGSPYGGVELLVSSFSEVGAAEGEKLTKAKQQAVVKALTEQAQRGIASRYPAPYVVRVPDGTALAVTTPVEINQLVPGVWVPVRAKGTVIEIAQWQKLDAVTVTETAQGEEVAVTLSPAPNRGQDPDADAAAEEASA